MRMVSDCPPNDDLERRCLDFQRWPMVSARFSFVSVHPSAVSLQEKASTGRRAKEDTRTLLNHGDGQHLLLRLGLLLLIRGENGENLLLILRLLGSRHIDKEDLRLI